MSSITTRQGDTFDLLARRAYGDDSKSALLRQANPGLSEPLEAGVIVNVPSAPSATPASTSADNENELALLIDGKAFKFWTEISITRTIDAMDQVSIAAPFDPDDATFRAAFKPFGFNPVEVLVGGSALFTGVMLTPDPEVTDKSRTVSAVCYSTPAVLNDCTAPASMYPLEWNDASLRTIAADLAAPFGLDVTFEADAGAIFERVALNPGQKVLSFLASLAQQRGLLISSTERGELLFTESVGTGSPVAVLREGESPLTSVTPAFNPQEYYSEITGIEPVVVGLAGSQFTVRNERLRGVVRPYTFEVADTLNADVQSAVNNKAGRMFGNVVNYAVTVATWRDPNGDLWQPNTTLKIESPGVMIYAEYEFLIRSVTLTRTEKGDVATLIVTLPGAFSSEIPEALPWG